MWTTVIRLVKFCEWFTIMARVAARFILRTGTRVRTSCPRIVWSLKVGVVEPYCVIGVASFYPNGSCLSLYCCWFNHSKPYFDALVSPVEQFPVHGCEDMMTWYSNQRQALLHGLKTISMAGPHRVHLALFFLQLGDKISEKWDARNEFGIKSNQIILCLVSDWAARKLSEGPMPKKHLTAIVWTVAASLSAAVSSTGIIETPVALLSSHNARMWGHGMLNPKQVVGVHFKAGQCYDVGKQETLNTVKGHKSNHFDGTTVK